jgi:uncharacterized membrane protein
MKKNEFLRELKKHLEFYSRSEQNEVLNYYDELIQDAADHGEEEKAFIDSLGPIDDIVVSIKKDSTFFDKVRSKIPFTVSEAFDMTVKVIGYTFFAIFAFTILTISFSFFISGIGVIFVSAYQLVVNLTQDTMTTLLRLSQMVVGLGLVILGIAMFKWFVSAAKTNLEQLLVKIQSLVK